MRTNLLDRISPEHLQAYLDRRMSSKEIARLYQVKRDYATRTLPKRAKPEKDTHSKQQLRGLRWEFRDHLAMKVHTKHLTIEEASRQANCSLRTMFRHLARVRVKLGLPPTETAAEAADAA